MEDLKLLIQSRYPILYVETYEEERLEELLVAAATELGLPFWTWSVTQGLERKGIDQPVYDTTKPLVALRHIASLSTSGLYLLRDFHPYLTDPTVVRELREFAQTVSGRLVTLVLCSPALELPIELRKLSARYQLDLPDEQEIRMAVVETFRQLNAHHRFRYELDEAALTRFARNLRGLTMAEVRRLVTRSAFDDFALNEADIPRVLERKRAALESSSTLEFVSVDSGVAPLGGLAHLKQWLDRFRAGFSERARELGLPAPRGVLLVGVQGCGKSLAAKTIARRWEIPLARLDPSRLYDKYIGESEKNLRDALATASAAAPIVLWIDEIEKVFADTGGDADAGLGRRLFGTFLTWLQERKEMVFVAATANELDRLPPELLRKGRFDEIFFIDLPGEARAQGDLRHPPAPAQAGPGEVRPSAAGARHRRLQRRRDRADGGRRDLRHAGRERRDPHHPTPPRRDRPHLPPLLDETRATRSPPPKRPRALRDGELTDPVGSRTRSPFRATLPRTTSFSKLHRRRPAATG